MEQNTDTAYTDALHCELDAVNKATANLVKALEAGVFNVATKARMDELEQQRLELESALAASKLKFDLGLKKEHILYFLEQFTTIDYEDEACKKRLIKTFINLVFVYDDKVVLTFNYSGSPLRSTRKKTLTVFFHTIFPSDAG